jgi:hypothetical protein
VFHLVRAANCENVGLASRIWTAADAPQVKRIVNEDPIPSPGLNFDVSLMRKLLQAKFEQCAEFREALQASGDLPLLHSTYEADQIWATGLHYMNEGGHSRCLAEGSFPGQNLHGKLLMELRSTYFGGVSQASVPLFPANSRPARDLPSLLDFLPSDLTMPPPRSSAIGSAPHPSHRSLFPLLKEKPRSLMDVKVDPCFIMPWYHKHGYFMSSMLHTCSPSLIPFRRSQPTVYRM